jgi:hypothetical protein
VDAGEHEPERPGLEGGEVGAAVKALEGLLDAGELDVAQAVDGNREAADELEQFDLARVVDECGALVVAGGVRDQQAIAGWQLLADGLKAREVVGDLLDCDQIEPAEDLCDQPVVPLLSLLYPEFSRCSRSRAAGGSSCGPERRAAPCARAAL